MPLYWTGTILAVSVMPKVTVTPSAWRLTLPGSTTPPSLNVRPVGASFAATCVGEKKKTRFSLKACRASVTPAPTATTAAPMRASFLVFESMVYISSVDLAARASRARRAQILARRARREKIS